MSDDRPRKSWREIDKARDGSSHRSDDRPPLGGQSPRGQRRQRSYRAALDRLFNSGKISELVAEKAPEAAQSSGTGKDRLKELARIRDAASREDVTREVDAFLKQHPLPDDIEILTRVLEHRDPGIQLQAMERIEALLEEHPPKRVRALVGQLKMIRDLADDRELTEIASRLIERL